MRPRSAKELVESGDMIAVIGDSITEQKQYSVFIEDYLLMCQPAEKLQVAQFGWGGETATGFEKRMKNDMLRFKPMLITTCFGMNDGGYAAADEGAGRFVSDFDAADHRQGEEGGSAHDYHRFARLRGYRQVSRPKCRRSTTRRSASCADIAREVAEANGVAFADVHTPMMDAMKKAKAKYGKEYHVGGGDGVHPDANGHLVMAYAFLKALGCDGEHRQDHGRSWRE